MSELRVLESVLITFVNLFVWRGLLLCKSTSFQAKRFDYNIKIVTADYVPIHFSLPHCIANLIFHWHLCLVFRGVVFWHPAQQYANPIGYITNWYIFFSSDKDSQFLFSIFTLREFLHSSYETQINSKHEQNRHSSGKASVYLVESIFEMKYLIKRVSLVNI